MGEARKVIRFYSVRQGIVLFLGLLALSLFAIEASAKTVSDPNHKGWYGGKFPLSELVGWRPIKTNCEKCVKITEQYNQTIPELFSARFQVNWFRERLKLEEKQLKKSQKKQRAASKKGDISSAETSQFVFRLEEIERYRAQLEFYKKSVRILEQHAQYLSKAISDCERNACPAQKPTKQKKVKIGGESTKTIYQPDVKAILKQYKINWQGPYSSRCKPCKDIIDDLNALPGWVVRAHMELQRAELNLEGEKLIPEGENGEIEALHYANNRITIFKDNLAALKKLFETLLSNLSECEAKYCPTQNSEPISVCPDPKADALITVGANSDVGSSANFKEKAKKKVAGLATKAITGLLGIGGGGGGGKSKGPTTYKDPVKNKNKLKVKDKPEKRDIRVGGVFTEDGLLISTDIKKAPGKGTFQTVYLQNLRGWRLVPIRLFMYEIWKEWKLNVSWTRDTYVDGELVKHEEGGWSESWRELIAKGQQIEYAEVPIWEQLGFNTAVSGARSIGTLFDVTPEMLAREPINLVIHITDPKKNPVVTYPYIFKVSLGNKGKIIVERVEQTEAAAGSPCESPQDVFNDGDAPIIDSEAASTPLDTPVASPSSIEQPAAPITGINTTNLENSTPLCPNGWVCTEGKSCPPITNCTIATNNSPSGPLNNDLANDDIEEVAITGTRLGGPTPEDPVSTKPDINNTNIKTDDIDEVDVTGIPPSSIPNNPELEYSLTDSNTKSYLRSAHGIEGYDTADESGDDTALPPSLELTPVEEEPPIIGVALSHFDADAWIPTHDDHTAISAKIYVPHPSRANIWIPHNSAKRKITIRFIARSNEPGKAMNANIGKYQEDAPDLYFKASDNFGVDCRDDPTANGHFGTCVSKYEKNELEIFIRSGDYGGYSRLDVSCDGCVPLKILKDQMPEGSHEFSRWPLAIEERDQEKRAVYVPKDDNRNQIADPYIPDLVHSPSATQDNEIMPYGNGVAGDGLSAYEEYRGFFDSENRHHRTDWYKKTFFIENIEKISTAQFAKASGLEVLDIEAWQHRQRVVNFNSDHANLVDQHGVSLRIKPNLGDRVGGYCFCDPLERPKTSDLVAITPGQQNKSTVAHELGHSVGMQHHGDTLWPTEKEEIRPMTSGLSDLLPGRVHTGNMLCGKTLPASFYIGTKGDQASGHENCIMSYFHENFAYEQEAGDYDCRKEISRSIFDDSPKGTGRNGFHRTADDASRGNCMSQIWINSK